MKVVITGGAGFLGKKLARQILKQGTLANAVGGLLSNHVGHVPHRGEIITLPPMRSEVLRADARQVHLLLVHRETMPLAADHESHA